MGSIWSRGAQESATAGTQEHTHRHAHMCAMHRVGRPQVLLGLLPPRFGLCSWRKVHSDGEVGGGREKGLNCSQQVQVWGEDKRGCAGLGPSSGRRQVGLLVPWQGPRGQTAQPMPTPGLASSPAHTLSHGLGNTGSEIPTIPSSPSAPAHLLSERNLHNRALRRGRASMVHNLR